MEKMLEIVTKKIVDYIYSNSYLKSFFNNIDNTERVIEGVKLFIYNKIGCDVKDIDGKECEELGKWHVSLGIPLNNILEMLDYVEKAIFDFCKQEGEDCKGICSQNIEHVKTYIAKGYLQETVRQFDGFEISLYSVFSTSKIPTSIHSWVININEAIIDENQSNTLMDVNECDLATVINSPFMNLIFNTEYNRNEFNRRHEKLHNIASSIFFFLQSRNYAQAYVIYKEFLDHSREFLTYYNDRYVLYAQNKYYYLEKYISELIKDKNKVFIATINIRNMKHINSLWGDETGDYVIERVHKIVDKHYGLYSPESIYILNKNAEFVIAMQETDKDETLKVFKHLCKTINNLCIFKGSFNIEVNAACALTYLDSQFVDNEISLAKITGYITNKSKQVEKSHSLFHQEDADLMYKDLIEADHKFAIIRNALNKSQVQAFFQPIYDSQTRKPLYVEALARIRNNDKIMPAGMFIDTLIEMNKAVELDSLMVSRISEEIEQISETGTNIFMNVNSRSLNSESYLFNLAKLLYKSKDMKSDIIIEITEQTLFDDFDILKKLHADFNISFAIDDFGTGYSNFKILAEMSSHVFLKYVKIDGSLINTMKDKNEILQIVKGITYISKSLGLETVAEFIDNEKTMSLVNDLDIDYSQGFLLGKPADLETTLKVLADK